MVYFICSRVNKEDGQNIVDFLKKKMIDVYFPIVETPQEPLSLMFKTNIDKISSSEFIVAFAKGEITRNWAFEAGYALALGKTVLCLVDKDTDLDQQDMVRQKLVKVQTLEALENELEKITKNF